MFLGSVTAAPLRIGVVADGGRRGFTSALHAGMSEAAGTAVSLEWRETNKPSDRTAQAQFVDELVAARVDAIVLDASDRQVLRTPVERAVKAGVPVVLVDSAIDGEAETRMVATDNRAAGREAARLVGGLLDGRGGVLLLRYQIHAARTEQREEGFIEGITREFPGVRLVSSDYHVGPTVESATRVVETLLQRYAGGIDAVFASSETGTLGMLATLRRLNLAAGKVKLVGSDEGGDELAAALRAGDLQGFVAEDPTAMGRAAAKAAMAIVRRAKVAAIMPVEFAIVTAAGRHVVSLPTERAIAETGARFECPPCLASVGPATSGFSKDSFVVTGLDLPMIAVAPGSFTRSNGASVRLTHAYWLGQCEVTQRQWTEVMGYNPSDFRGDCLPVDNVAWTEAMAFCEKLTTRERTAGRLPRGYAYSLPTEAQWEFAARAGAPLVTAIAALEQGAWGATTSGGVQPASGVWRMSTHPVGTRPANPWGFYDLGGNVAEWCLDWQDEYPEGDQTDPRGPQRGTYRVLRGGSWWADVQNCRADSRHRGPPGRHHDALGLRVALSFLSP